MNEESAMVRRSGWLPQFSVRWLLVGLAILSVGLAAATNAGHGWTLILAIVFHLILPVSIVFAIHRAGERRAFWVGVAVVNLWFHLALGKGEFLVRERQQNEIASIVDAYVAAPLVRLQQSRVEQRTNQRVQAEVAALGLAVKITPADLSSTKSRLETEFREAITSSLMRLLMILGSMCGGWLAHWAYRHPCRAAA